MATWGGFAAGAPGKRAGQGGSRGRSVDSSGRFESQLRWMLLGMIQNWGWVQAGGAGACAPPAAAAPHSLAIGGARR